MNWVQTSHRFLFWAYAFDKWRWSITSWWIIDKLDFQGCLVSCKHLMPVWLSDRSHVNKIVPVWVCIAFMKSGCYCSWVSKDVLKHPWEPLDFSLKGCLQCTWHQTVWFSFWYKFSLVPSFLCICLYDYSRISPNSVSHTCLSLPHQWHQITIFIPVQKPIPISRKHGITVWFILD